MSCIAYTYTPLIPAHPTTTLNGNGLHQKWPGRYVVPTIFLLFSPYLLIGRSVFVAVQGSCTYAGTKLCLNDHYLCETFSLGWTIHHCNATPMWWLISLLVSHIEHLSQLAWMPTYGTAIRDFRHQTAVYLESLLWHELTATAPCQAGVTSKTMCERQSCTTGLLA